VADPSNPVKAGAWTVTFSPQVIDISVAFEIYHIAVKGPAGSTFQIFLDTVFYDAVSHGDLNSWDPAQPMLFTPGRSMYFYYDVSVAPAPLVTIYCREVTT
jgi:hypothetical protein